MTIPDAQRLRELEQENGRLKRLLAERDLDVRCAKGMAGKTSVTVAGRREGVQCLVAYGLAQRHACLLLPLPRATFNDQARPERHVGLVEEGCCDEGCDVKGGNDAS